MCHRFYRAYVHNVSNGIHASIMRVRDDFFKQFGYSEGNEGFLDLTNSASLSGSCF